MSDEKWKFWSSKLLTCEGSFWNPSEFTRFTAVREMTKKYKDPKAVELLLKCLGDEAMSVRREISKALGELREHVTPEQLQRIRDGLKEDSWRVRQTCAYAAGELKMQESLTQLFTLLKDRELLVRQAAAESLGKIRDRRAVEPLIEALLHDPNYFAAEPLRRLGDPRALEPLVERYIQEGGAIISGMARDFIWRAIVDISLESGDHSMNKVQNIVLKKLSEAEDKEQKKELVDFLGKINAKRNELLAQDAKELPKPNIQRRRKPKRFWRSSSRRLGVC